VARKKEVAFVPSHIDGREKNIAEVAAAAQLNRAAGEINFTPIIYHARAASNLDAQSAILKNAL
jgi:hypothetical protein